MKEFTSGTSTAKFDLLRRQLELSPGTIRVFSGVRLPAAHCRPATVRLGFKATQQGSGFAYTTYIDPIHYTGSNYLFRQWVIDGDWTFPNWEALVTFYQTQLKNL